MKLKHLALGLAATALVSGSASAATVLHIAGSTAYRTAVTAAIINYLKTNGGGSAPKAVYKGTGAATSAGLFGAGQAIFVSSNGNLIVKTDWTGSIAGVVDLVENNNLPWYPSTETTTGTALSFTTVTTSASSVSASTTSDSPAVGNDSTGPNLAMSDSFYTSVSALVGTADDSSGNGPKFANDITSSTITPAATPSYDEVGVVPFAWWAGTSSAAPAIDNVPQQTAYQLTLAGYAPVSLFSGSGAALAGQKGNIVYLIGRNEDSGTRTAALLESQGSNTGANPNSFSDSVVQYYATFTATTGTVATDGTLPGTQGAIQTGGSNTALKTLQQWPAGQNLSTETSLAWSATGHSGYISGGDVKNVLLATNSTPSSITFPKTDGAPEQTGSAFLIGYLGWADGFGVSHTPLKYNGVTLSTANIENGAYSFWAFEHSYYLQQSAANGVGTGSAPIQTLADGIANLVATTYAPTDSNGDTATTSFPVASSTVDANEDALTAQSTNAGAPAGLIINSNLLATRSVEGGNYSLTY